MNLIRIAQAAAVVGLVGSLSACPADTDSESTPTDDVATSEAPAEDTPTDEETDDSLDEDMGEDTDAPADQEDTDTPADEEETPAEEDLQ